MARSSVDFVILKPPGGERGGKIDPKRSVYCKTYIIIGTTQLLVNFPMKSIAPFFQI